MADMFEVIILEDGTIKTTTDRISQANHSAADGFFSVLKKLCGGLQERKNRGKLGHVHNGVSHVH